MLSNAGPTTDQWLLLRTRQLRRQGVKVARTANIHRKDHHASIICYVKNGFVRHINGKKAHAWSRSIGRQLPKDMETKHRLGREILRHSDVFKALGARTRTPLNVDHTSFH